jgi:hypothetical protein
MQGSIYQASFDLIAKIVSNLVCLMGLVLFGLGIYMRSAAYFLPAALLIIVVVISWGFHPVKYQVLPGRLEIERPLGAIKIASHDIESIQRVTMNDLGLVIRLFGSGGLFGYFGAFTSRKLGRFKMWCTNRNNLVLITTNYSKLVVSPDEPDDFIMNLRLQNKLL